MLLITTISYVNIIESFIFDHINLTFRYCLFLFSFIVFFFHKNLLSWIQLLEMYKVEEEEYQLTTKREFYA